MTVVKIIASELTRPLRHKVLWPHIGKTQDCIIDIDTRADAIHLGAFKGDDIIGICSLFQMESPRINAMKPYRLRAMATDPNYRGQRVGMKIIDYAINLLREKEVDFLWCDARKIALGFYEKMGFEVVDEWYEVPNIGLHKTAYYRLS